MSDPVSLIRKRAYACPFPRRYANRNWIIRHPRLDHRIRSRRTKLRRPSPRPRNRRRRPGFFGVGVHDFVSHAFGAPLSSDTLVLTGAAIGFFYVSFVSLSYFAATELEILKRSSPRHRPRVLTRRRSFSVHVATPISPRAGVKTRSSNPWPRRRRELRPSVKTDGWRAQVHVEDGEATIFFSYCGLARSSPVALSTMTWSSGCQTLSSIL